MALSRLPEHYEEVSSRSPKEAAMGLEAGLGEALRTDYFMLREEFTPAQLDYLERTRGFVHEEVLPVISGCWGRAEFPWPLIKKLGAAGLAGDGILLDFHVVRHMADIEAIHTFEGTATIQSLITGRDITVVSAFTAGA
jgi:hypothetical protein